MKDYPLGCRVSAPGDWTIRTHDGREIHLSGVLSYDPKEGAELTGHCSMDIEALREEKRFFIVTSESNNLNGCTIFQAYVSSTAYRGEHCDVKIKGASVITNYVHNEQYDKCFNKAVLYYDHIDIFWEERIINSHSKKVEHGIYITPGMKTLFSTSFEKCKISLSEYATVLSGHAYSNAKVITKLDIESDSPLDYFEMLFVSHEANRALNFIRGNVNNFSSLAFYKPFQTDDPFEELSCKSSVLFNTFYNERTPTFIPIVYFRERDNSESIIKTLYGIYPKYRTSILSALSSIGNDNDVMYKFFAICRALESAYSIEKEPPLNDCLKIMISKMSELVPADLDETLKNIIHARIKTIGNKTLTEKLEDIDDQLFRYTGFAVGLKSRGTYEGLASSITAVRNSIAHFNKKVTKTRADEYQKYYLLLKRCFFAYLFMKAEVDSEYIRVNILRYEFLAE